MNAIRTTFLASSQLALDLVRSPVVARRWDEPSALREFSVRGLVGHLFRATGSVDAYLNRPEPKGPAIDAPTYLSEAVDVPDIYSELHRSVRQRGEEASAKGHAALVRSWTSLLQRMEERLESEPPHRSVEVFKGLVLSLDDYLVTRVVELVVHIDDVAESVESPAPQLPVEAYDVAIDCLVRMGRLRHGDPAVVRALARRERDSVDALRVL
jgi:hypothetical protein